MGQPLLCFCYRERGHSTSSLLSDSLAKLEAGAVTKCNFAGDGKMGSSWTDNILAQKSCEGADVKTREQGDGAEDEEWVGRGRRLGLRRRWFGPWWEFCVCWLWVGGGQGASSMGYPPALVGFRGIPESVLASEKFLQGMQGNTLGPFFLVGLNCANLQESPTGL